MFSSGGTCSAPFAANCIMFDGSLEARIRSIVRGISSPPAFRRKVFRRKDFARQGSAARLTRSGLEFLNRKLQFSNQPVRLAPKKFLHQSPVVPKSAIAPALEALPNRFANFAVVGEYGADIV